MTLAVTKHQARVAKHGKPTAQHVSLGLRSPQAQFLKGSALLSAQKLHGSGGVIICPLAYLDRAFKSSEAIDSLRKEPPFENDIAWPAAKVVQAFVSQVNSSTHTCGARKSQSLLGAVHSG